MGLLIASGVLALLAWCVIPTELMPEDVRNSKGEITVRRILSVVLIQIVIWALVFHFSLWIVPHLPRFLITGWRLPLTFLFLAFWKWFALLMILQYAWTLLGTTVKTAVVFVMAEFGSRSARQSLDDAPWRFLETERLTSIERKRIGRTS
jgi:hypothetical protein